MERERKHYIDLDVDSDSPEELAAVEQAREDDEESVDVQAHGASSYNSPS